MPSFPVVHKAAKDAPREQKKAANKKRREQLSQLSAWWLRRMTGASDPFEDKWTFCLHNHFATAATKVHSAQLMSIQNQTLRRLGRGDFRTLAQAMLVDPAMLYWLDGQKNTVKGANENLAREFMELFALGHGNYTETDVREGARALTGWTFDKKSSTDQAVFRPKLHDEGQKTILGVTGNLDQAGYGDAVLAQAAGARYLITRTYGQLVSDTPPDAATVARLVSAYGPKRDISALLRTMFTDRSFAAQANSYVIGPVEWLVGALRSTRVELDDAAATKLLRPLRQLGQVPFYPPSVGGWPSGQAWLSTAAAQGRLQCAAAFMAKADLSAVSDAPSADRIDAVGYLLGVGRWSARSVTALKPSLGNPAALVTVALNTPEYLVH